MNHTFYTAIEIASILKISKALAYRLIANGDIPSIRFGRTVRVRQEDLDEFIEKNSSSSLSQRISHKEGVSDIIPQVSSKRQSK